MEYVGIACFTGIFLQGHGNVRLMLPEGSSVAAATQAISKDQVIICDHRENQNQIHPYTSRITQVLKCVRRCQENFSTDQTLHVATMPRPSAAAMKRFGKLLRSCSQPKTAEDSWDGIINLENKVTDKSGLKQDGAPLTGDVATKLLPSCSDLLCNRKRLKKAGMANLI